jgi:nucleoside 2-deoxyribosyltransferase
MEYDFYFAAPLFSRAETEFNYWMANRLALADYKVFLPQLYPNGSATEIFHRNLENLKKSNAVIAICDGSDVDSGTSWECGYFFDKGNMFALRTDFRIAGDDVAHGINLMISQGATRIFSDADYMLSWIIDNIQVGNYG